MGIKGIPYDPTTDFDEVTMKSNPFVVTKILKNSVWIKELQIEQDDIIFFDTNYLFTSYNQHLTAVNLTKNLKVKNSISFVDRIYPKKDKNGTLKSDIVEYKIISWDDYAKMITKSEEESMIL